tara:strand:- start:277 stop:612 length:336 start_codon:yes stop_codon:yes gene_type:complete
MNFYEHTVVTKQDLSSTEIEKIQSKYNDIINSSSGKVVKIEKWGLLNFARKINNYNKGFYIHYKFEGNNKTVDEIKKNSIVDNSVLRHLTIKYKKLDLETEYFKKENEKKK